LPHDEGTDENDTASDEIFRFISLTKNSKTVMRLFESHSAVKYTTPTDMVAEAGSAPLKAAKTRKEYENMTLYC
jgi:hypothetical protein